MLRNPQRTKSNLPKVPTRTKTTRVIPRTAIARTTGTSNKAVTTVTSEYTLGLIASKTQTQKITRVNIATPIVPTIIQMKMPKIAYYGVN